MAPRTIMNSFSPSFVIFCFGVILLGVVPTGQSPHGVIAAPDPKHDAMIDALHDKVCPGVAFSLHDGYGTVAVKLMYQAPVAVARVEGSEAYKHLMRTANEPVPIKVQERDIWCDLFNAAVPLSFQEHLGYCREDPDPNVEAVQALLLALRKSAEAYLGHTICLANIIFPEHAIEMGYLERIIDIALANLDLTRALDLRPSAYGLALRSEGLDELHEELGVPECLLLTIETTSSGIVHLDLPLLDEIGPSYVRRHHNITGTTLPPECLNQTSSCVSLRSKRREAIREALTAITEPPFEETVGDEDMPTSISKILVYGDSADDEVLQEELLALFGPELASHAIAQQPTFAVALGGAWLAFFRINSVSYGGRPSQSWWCCLRSWGKGCTSTEQRIDL